MIPLDYRLRKYSKTFELCVSRLMPRTAGRDMPVRDFIVNVRVNRPKLARSGKVYCLGPLLVETLEATLVDARAGKCWELDSDGAQHE